MLPAEAPTGVIGSKQNVLGSIKEKSQTSFKKRQTFPIHGEKRKVQSFGIRK